jgi:hypothetical protein
MKYNVRNIMRNAWKLFKSGKVETFAESLHRAWICEKAIPVNAEIVRKAKADAGVEEECKTWFGWKEAGFMVAHGSKCLFQASLIYGSKGDGAMYKASFFGRSQVEELAVA